MQARNSVLWFVILSADNIHKVLILCGTFLKVSCMVSGSLSRPKLDLHDSVVCVAVMPHYGVLCNSETGNINRIVVGIHYNQGTNKHVYGCIVPAKEW